MQIFHVATEADWARAQVTGRYTTSTFGVTLEQEGFIHASRADQWEAVRERFYGDVTEPLVTFRHTYVFADGTRLVSDSTLEFRTLDQLTAATEAAGFEVVEVRDAPDRPGLEHVLLCRAR